MHFCAREGALDVAEMLIKRGADVDAKCVAPDQKVVVLPIDVAVSAVETCRCTTHMRSQRQSGRTPFVGMIEGRRRDQQRLYKALVAVRAMSMFSDVCVLTRLIVAKSPSCAGYRARTSVRCLCDGARGASDGRRC